MIVQLTLDVGAGTDLGLFDLYSDTDSYAVNFNTSPITRQQLLDGYITDLVPNGTIIIRITSTGDCTNSYDSTVDLLYVNVKYGYLYNWYTVDDAREISNTGWSTPTKTQLETLETFLGGSSVAGGKLKETGLTYWDSPNTGATNSSNFNSRGAGFRSSTVFEDLKSTNSIMSITLDGAFNYVMDITLVVENTAIHNTFKYLGVSVRLIKDTTTLSDGETSIYTSNDGKIYDTICIGTQEWLSENLIETKYRNNDSIPEVTNQVTWAGLTTGARCSYDNDESNAI